MWTFAGGPWEGTITDVHVRTLRRAAEIVGGPEALAFRLKVTPSHLALWMSGLEPAPTYVFLRAVDLVLERDSVEEPPPEAEGPKPSAS